MMSRVESGSGSTSSAAREATLVAAMWCVSAAYTVGYCAWFGYGRATEDLKFVLGFPDWVFWGILAPWSVCLVASIWFAFRVMKDEELGEDTPAVSTKEEPSHE